MTVSASASSFTSPIQSATSPRLMPTKSRPTTALVFGQQAESLQPHLLPPPLQDNESLSSDEFVLSTASGSCVPAAAAGGDNHSKTSSARSGLKTIPNSSSQDDQSSESGDDADGRLTDTESEHVRAQTRTGTPVIAGRSNNHHGAAEHGPTSALQSLREIEEHDHEGRQTQLQGLESRFRTITLAQDQDLTSEGGDSTTESDTQPKSAMDPVQIQGKSTLICNEVTATP
ncbi:hypothetical protein BGW39_005700 [Mortierella sp. 14UC]|nr:hypothetical protein BGW39_005700 [Mortierella sp. 14UC]